MKKLVISMAMSILCIAVFAACSLEKEKEVVPEYVLTYAENQSENYPTTQCARKSAEYEKELWDEYSENAKAEAIKNGCVVTSWSKEEVQKCKDMIDPLYEKYCATYMYLIKEIQEKNYEIH